MLRRVLSVFVGCALMIVVAGCGDDVKSEKRTTTVRQTPPREHRPTHTERTYESEPEFVSPGEPIVE